MPTLLGFSRSERITHRFIRNLLKTDCNNLATLIAHHHMCSDMIDLTPRYTLRGYLREIKGRVDV